MPSPVEKVPPLSIVILAAGQGKRMNSSLPKVLHPLAGQPLLAHVLERAATLQSASIHVVYGHGGEQVRAALARDDIQWALQAEQLGTGHALQQAMPAIPDDHLVLVLYGDVPLIDPATLRQLIALAGPRALALLTVELPDPTGYGRIIREGGAVQRIVEQKDASAEQLRIREGNSGVLAAPAGLLKQWLARLRADNAQREYYLTDVIAMAVSEQIRVSPLLAPTAAEVLGVNDKLQLAELEGEYRRARARELMKAGVTLIDPSRIDIRGAVTAGRDVTIDINVVLEGPVHLGDGVRVGPNCVLSKVQVGAGTHFKPNCVIEQATIGARCEVGPFARVRPGTVLADEVHLGNFVEIKNSQIAGGSKVNHLSYVGDTTMGSRVNIGAGTITCNYDGANKFRTEIGNDVFIGSGAMLVAPLQIGTGATIGAGSTITLNVPGGKLTLERGRQITIDSWQRPTKRNKDQ